MPGRSERYPGVSGGRRRGRSFSSTRGVPKPWQRRLRPLATRLFAGDWSNRGWTTFVDLIGIALRTKRALSMKRPCNRRAALALPEISGCSSPRDAATSEPLACQDVEVRLGYWIGARVTMCGGVVIGKSGVIEAGSLMHCPIRD